MPGTARDHAFHLPKRRIVSLITIGQCAIHAHHNAVHAHHSAHVEGAGGVLHGARYGARQLIR